MNREGSQDIREITSDMLSHAKKCRSRDMCDGCLMNTSAWSCCTEALASALEAERAKGPGVWEDAPIEADLACIKWYAGLKKIGLFEYRRDPSKTSSRLRAESIIGPKGEKLDGDEWERAVAAVAGELV